MKENFPIEDNYSLILPDGEIITEPERKEIITNSLDVPVRKYEQEIKDVIRGGVCSVLIGETGSGKTTELPQMIHEVYPDDIVITNIPLVSATIGTASYVSKIMYCKTGNPYYALGNGGVGYRTGKGNSEKGRTQLGFHTYGLEYLNLSLGNFERFLQSSTKNLHIVLDEIHEKSEDFIFYFSKILKLAKKFPNRVKIYGASATISDNYLDLLLDRMKILSKEVPVLRVEGRTFPIKDFEKNEKNAVDEAIDLYQKGKSILIFQPGKAEIAKTIKQLQEKLGNDIQVFEFHSQVSQSVLEENLKNSYGQKIFVATNAARTGITIDINSVIDDGLQKNQYFNEDGIPILMKEAISHDAYMQNRGRAGRKEDGIAIYTGGKKLKELDLESKSSVEIKVDERKILSEILFGENILSNETRGVNNYIYKPNREKLQISYENLKEVGLITKNEKLTKLGFDALKLPIGAFNARCILEAIDLGVAEDVILMTSIIEENGFVKKEFNFKKFKANFFDKNFSDLDIYKKIYDILYSTKIDDNILATFQNMGIDGKLINYFKSLDGKARFIDIVGEEIEEIGLSFKSLISIGNRVEKIFKNLENNEKFQKSLNSDFEEKERKEKISKSLLSGYLHNIYSAVGSKKFEDFFGKNKLEFENSDRSFLDIHFGMAYIGTPFIIGADLEDKDDKNILSFLTQIEPGDIELYQSKEYSEYIPKKSDLQNRKFQIDVSGDTFEVPKFIVNKDEKQKYLATNWLPYFLIEKNQLVGNFIKTLGENYDRDVFVRLLQKITIKISPKINPENKDENVKKFIEDDEILKNFIKSSDEEIQKFLNGEEIIVHQENNFSNKDDFFESVKKSNEFSKKIKEIVDFFDENQEKIEKINLENFDEIIKFLEENSFDYSKLIIFLKNIKNSKEGNIFKLKIKQEFEDLDSKNAELMQCIKKKTSTKSFVNELKTLQETGKFSFSNFCLGVYQNDELLLSDPIIKTLDVLNKANKLFSLVKKIDFLLEKCDFTEKQKIKFKKGMKNLLFVNKNKFYSGKKSFNDFVSLIDKKIKIKDDNSKMHQLHILKNKIIGFESFVLNFRKRIEKIDFEKIVFSKKENVVFTEKFLSNLIIGIVFHGEKIKISDKNDEKILEKFAKILGNFDDAEKVFVLIKHLSLSFGDENLKNELKKYIENLENKVENLIQEEEVVQSEIANLKNANGLYESVYGLLNEFFNEEDLEVQKSKILNFARKIPSLNMKNFDEKFLNFISKFPLHKMKILGESFVGLDKIDDLKYEVDEISKIGVEEFGDENIDQILVKMSKKFEFMKEFLQKN
ncbi:hypothetical protein LR002_01860 [Candidatus Gracilibacteria bacterium]|nr:hypothetical protein [Candidatus Gracilibacteria bacterium]